MSQRSPVEGSLRVAIVASCAAPFVAFAVLGCVAYFCGPRWAFEGLVCAVGLIGSQAIVYLLRAIRCIACHAPICGEILEDITLTPKACQGCGARIDAFAYRPFGARRDDSA